MDGCFDGDAFLATLIHKYDALQEGKWAQIEKDFNKQAPEAKSRQWLKNRAKKIQASCLSPKVVADVVTPSRREESKSKFDFNQKFWDDKYAALGAQEWITGYKEMSQIFESAVPDKKSGILVVGCGDSPFSADLYAAGYTNITNVDYSSVCIELMSKRHSEMTWKVADATNMDSIDDEVFDVIIEKSLVDTFVAAKTTPDEREFNVTNMWAEMWRVLKPGGKYFSLNFILEAMEKGWAERCLSNWTSQMTAAMGGRQPWEILRAGVKTSPEMREKLANEDAPMFICMKPSDLSISQLG